MGGKMSRNKGGSGEREVAGILKAGLGIDISRTPRSGAWKHAKGDLYGVPGFNVEVKRQERTRVEEWYQQSVDDTKEGEIPLLIYRRSRQPWKVVISLDHFIDIMKSHIERNQDEQ